MKISKIFTVLVVLTAVFTVTLGGSGCSNPSDFPEANIVDNPMDVAKKIRHAILNNNRKALASCLTSSTTEDIDLMLKIFNTNNDISRALREELKTLRFTRYDENGSFATVYATNRNGSGAKWYFKKVDSVWKLDADKTFGQ